MIPKEHDVFAFKLYDLARVIGSRYNTSVDVVVPQRCDHACMCHRCVGRRGGGVNKRKGRVRTWIRSKIF
jgi:hypothetical protein